MIDINRTGFTLITAGDENNNDKRVNIIFVHGLRGHPKHTWGRGSASIDRNGRNDRKKKRPPKPFWPDEYFRDDVPEARIWTYGYNANVFEGLFQACNKHTISQHGHDLAVAFERDIGDEYPVIWVAHGLGGIVVKAAICESQACQSRTKQLIFLATPHRGIRPANRAKIALKLARLALQDVNHRLLESLRINSEILENIHLAFVDLVMERGFKIHSFYEGRGMTGVRGFHDKVVDDFSSKLDLPWDIESVESLDVNYKHMTKVMGREDEMYRCISSVVKNFMRSLPTETGEPMSREPAQCITTNPPQALGKTEPVAMINDRPFSDAQSLAGGEMRSKTNKSSEPGRPPEEELAIQSPSFILESAENRKHQAELLPEAKVEDSDTQEVEEQQPVSPSRDSSSTSNVIN